MLLSPHHFQQQDSYHESQLAARLASLTSYEWGVLNLEINRDAVTNGSFEITRCSAVMPDGLLLNLPDRDPAPEPRPIDEFFNPEDERLGVYLAVPAARPGAANYTSNGSGNRTARYRQEPGAVVDESSGEDERQIAFARANVRVLFEPEIRDGYSAIKIAELGRTATGRPALAENFVPPALSVSASPWLVNTLRGIVEILITKSSTLGERRRQRAGGVADFTTSETAVFWLLHTVNSSLPRLQHLFRTRVVHPERLYSDMIELLGALMTFATDRHPKDITSYDHENLHDTFDRLATEIRELLEIVIPTRCVPIPLEKTRESLYAGRVADERLLAEAAFYLGVRALVPESQLIERVPRIIKIASRDVIDAVIGSALPGVTLTHASPPPASIPTRLGFHYFALDSIGPYWQGIRGSKTLAVYVPDEFPDEKVEMYAIKP